MSDRPAHLAGRLTNIDGLRAVSVLLVILFHGRVLHVQGGFVGVSLFFTISGYLLSTRLLATPLRRSDVTRYWSRRWRRILPASWTVLLAVVVVEWATSRTPLDPGLRVLANAFGFGNWLQLNATGGYAALFEGGDSLVHYWSLGVEEQAYLVLPFVLVAVARMRRPMARLAVVTGLATLSFALPFVLSFGVARTYYGTDTRAGEILVGVALALAHHEGLLPRRMPNAAGSIALVGALGGIITLALVVRPGDAFVARGLLPLLAAFSTLATHGAVSAAGALGGLLDRRPLRSLGNVSYAVYLLHWPIMVMLRWRDIDDGVVTVIALAGSVLLSYPLVRLVETPLRYRANRATWTAWLAATALLLGALAIVVRPPAGTRFLDELERDAAQAQTQLTSPTTPPSATAPLPSTTAPSAVTAPTTTLPPPPPRIAVFGDSAALSIGLLIYNQVDEADVDLAGYSTELGCGIVVPLNAERCTVVQTEWAEFMATTPFDVAVLYSCQWELLDRELPGVGWRAAGDPAFDALLADGYRAALDLLLGGGAQKVVWALCPAFGDHIGPDTPETARSRDPQRVIALNAVITQVAAEYGDDVALLDLYSFVEPLRNDPALRPDGAHFAYAEPTPLSEALPDLLAAALAAGSSSNPGEFAP